MIPHNSSLSSKLFLKEEVSLLKSNYGEDNNNKITLSFGATWATRWFIPKISDLTNKFPEINLNLSMTQYDENNKNINNNNKISKTLKADLSLVTKKPDHVQALNALGYSMADANKNLNEAFDLIKAALTFAPQDPHIIDSMGWVYFRLGQLEMAEEWLEKAFNRQPDAEISAHYGEVLWHLSRKEDAIRIWKMGFNKEPNNAILLETVDRLKVHIDKLKGNFQN